MGVRLLRNCLGRVMSMNAAEKKQDERRVFDLVYASERFDEVIPNENPDFLLRREPGMPCFGVEITEYHVSETDARLDRLPAYSTDLLERLTQ